MATHSARMGALFLALTLALAALTSAAPVAAQGGGRFFPQTGHSVSEPFLSYWQSHGGLAIFGYPISDVQPYTDPASGHTFQAQWFERARFELHPENPAPYNVELGLLGVRAVTILGSQPPLSPAFTPIGAEQSPPGAAFFPQTGHSVDGAFLRYWGAHGGLAIFGYPLSQPFAEQSPTDGKTYTVQYFERARFELHPENPPPYNVELGLLGVQQYQPATVGAADTQIAINDGSFTARIVPGQTAVLGAGARDLTVTVRYTQQVRGQPFRVQIDQVDRGTAWQVAPSGRADAADSYSFALRGAADSPAYLRAEVIVGSGNPAVFFGVQLTDQLPGDPPLLADWSSGGLIRSYYNAVNRGEYARAYSYWEQPGRPNSAPADFGAFVDGYANTASVDVTLGAFSSDAGAGNLYVAVPTVLDVRLRQPQGGGDRQMFYGCYLLHGVNAPIDDTAPPYPLMIRSANIMSASANADLAALLQQATDLARAGQCG